MILALRFTQLDMEVLYGREGERPLQQLHRRMSQLAAEAQLSRESEAQYLAVKEVVWTVSMQRMYTLLDRSASTLPGCQWITIVQTILGLSAEDFFEPDAAILAWRSMTRSTLICQAGSSLALTPAIAFPNRRLKKVRWAL